MKIVTIVFALTVIATTVAFSRCRQVNGVVLKVDKTPRCLIATVEYSHGQRTLVDVGKNGSVGQSIVLYRNNTLCVKKYLNVMSIWVVSAITYLIVNRLWDGW